MPPAQRRVLVIGGGFAGLACGRDLKSEFLVTIVDAKEFFEYTPGVLRAYVKPKHLDALTFTLQPVIEGRMGCKFIWGEVLKLDGQERTAIIKPMFVDKEEVVDFDFCIIASGCNFGMLHKWGESLWFPTVHAEARLQGSWAHLDERFLEGRRRHILEEFSELKALQEKKANILVVGAGFIGVEWVTELEHFFYGMKLHIIDMLPLPLGPLPKKAAEYCVKYMTKKKIKQLYSEKYNPNDQAFWDKIGLPNKADKQYNCMGVKASNYFMPAETLSKFGPGGGKWILMDMTLAVKTKEGKPWATDDKGYARVYAIGDCNLGCVDSENHGEAGFAGFEKWACPVIPKISYPGEEEGVIACANISQIDRLVYRGEKEDHFGNALGPHNLHWPWGAGMFATSLGPDDACFVAGASWVKNSGTMCVCGQLCAVQKEIIEASKVDECANGFIGRCIWYFVHHTPVHLWGGGPLWGY
jgi:hypothetical protein